MSQNAIDDAKRELDEIEKQIADLRDERSKLDSVKWKSGNEWTVDGLRGMEIDDILVPLERKANAARERYQRLTYGLDEVPSADLRVPVAAQSFGELRYSQTEPPPAAKNVFASDVLRNAIEAEISTIDEAFMAHRVKCAQYVFGSCLQYNSGRGERRDFTVAVANALIEKFAIEEATNIAHTNALGKLIEALMSRVAALETRLDNYKHVGAWAPGRTFKRGNFITDKGSMFHALADTDERPGESNSWQLVVKRGQDGKDSGGAHGK